jgi:hypothetical protein
VIAVKLNANRNVVGVLRGFDQFMNLVLDNTLEVNGNDTTEIGMVVSAPSLNFWSPISHAWNLCFETSICLSSSNLKASFLSSLQPHERKLNLSCRSFVATVW